MSIKTTEANEIELETEYKSDLQTLKDIFLEASKVTEYAFPEQEYDRVFDILLPASSKIDSDTLSKLRNLGYRIDNISPTYNCENGEGHKYIGVVKE